MSKDADLILQTLLWEASKKSQYAFYEVNAMELIQDSRMEISLVSFG